VANFLEDESSLSLSAEKYDKVVHLLIFLSEDRLYSASKNGAKRWSKI
jgi:hypothetical protein